MAINMRMMYWLQAITPLHVGSGKGVGFIDMPIMREKVTNWPMVPGSAVKGVMRDYFNQKKEAEKEESERKKWDELINALFGKLEDDSSDANSGSLVLTDARIVCLPVRSLYGTFAYVTSPFVLERLRRDMAATGSTGLPSTPNPSEREIYLTGSKLYVEGKVFLEDLDFTAKPDTAAESWAEKFAGLLFPQDNTWQQIFKDRFAVISDDCFNFLSMTGTEVAAHIKIDDDKKMVSKHALWYEEALPAEAILAGIAWCDKIFGKYSVTEKDISDRLCPTEGLNLQIGGKATVGKGRARCLFH